MEPKGRKAKKAAKDAKDAKDGEEAAEAAALAAKGAAAGEGAVSKDSVLAGKHEVVLALNGMQEGVTGADTGGDAAPADSKKVRAAASALPVMLQSPEPHAVSPCPPWRAHPLVEPRGLCPSRTPSRTPSGG